MALLLNIDTATEQAGICLSLEEEILASEQAEGQKNHASFVQPAIQRVMHAAGRKLSAVDAVAVTGGPGSYTGLRVGLAAAKGICFALNKPLIIINTLQVMALASIGAHAGRVSDALFCPMIDARRMEVFTALYNAQLKQLAQPSAVVLDEASFMDELSRHTIIFSGSGSEKATIIRHPNAVFSSATYSVKHLAVLALMAYKTSTYASLAYSEPYYLKEFYKKA